MQSIRKEKRNLAAQAKRRKFATLGATESVGSLDSAIAALSSTETDKARAGLASLRHLLSQTEGAPIAQCHTENVSQLLVRLLARVADTETQISAAWCLTNLATGTHEETEKVLAAAPQLIAFLGSDVAELQEQAAWALGNVASDCQAFRLRLLKLNIMQPVMVILRREVHGSHWGLKHRTLWLLSHLARGYESSASLFLEPKAHEVLFEIVKTTLELGHALEERNASIVSEVMWCFSYLCAKEVECLATLVECGLIRLCTFILTTVARKDVDKLNVEILTPTLRALGNLLAVSNNAWKLEVARQSEVLSCLCVILDEWENYKDLSTDGAWLCSNLCAYGAHPTEPGEVIDREVVARTSEIFLPRLYWLFCNGNFSVQSEALYGLLKLASRGDEKILIWMLSRPNRAIFIDTLLKMLRKSDLDAMETSMDLIECILSKVSNPFAATSLGGSTGVEIIKGSDGVESFESVYYGKYPDDICNRAGEILDKYLTEEDFESGKISEESSNGISLDALAPASLGRGRAVVLPAWVTRGNNENESKTRGDSQQLTLDDFGFRKDTMDE